VLAPPARCRGTSSPTRRPCVFGLGCNAGCVTRGLLGGLWAVLGASEDSHRAESGHLRCEAELVRVRGNVRKPA
jgi:hypothetical protein